MVVWGFKMLDRVLKAKYYSNLDFINVRLGNLPSLTWKSIWAAKGLLKSGLCWRVGEGIKSLFGMIGGYRE
ncbi:reverse transcriptase [Gossypium australe]|uniref:Reverse transcriptase n=1 Tax=Gossypium australe TaxID=47621 RepID=A0A5B6VJC0_9ROSI|nr:reverse transcriptase [Gossypium australe]